MGFAVVADEVRNLAQRCARAASDTEALIDESIGTSNEGTQKLNRMAEAIQEHHAEHHGSEATGGRGQLRQSGTGKGH